MTAAIRHSERSEESPPLPAGWTQTRLLATSVSMESDDLDCAPFAQKGGLGRAHQLFGPELS
ncbi:MAG: hypothetical protein FJ279_08475 [Planctomycetes bacterium]|nr:hypothetical protein [Planctomycetota bacterium]